VIRARCLPGEDGGHPQATEAAVADGVDVLSAGFEGRDARRASTRDGLSAGA
jgi:hypothetical protein